MTCLGISYCLVHFRKTCFSANRYIGHLQRNRYKAMFYSVAIDLTCFSVCVCLLASFCHSYPNEFWERMYSYTSSVVSCYVFKEIPNGKRSLVTWLCEVPQ